MDKFYVDNGYLVIADYVHDAVLTPRGMCWLLLGYCALNLSTDTM